MHYDWFLSDLVRFPEFLLALWVMHLLMTYVPAHVHVHRKNFHLEKMLYHNKNPILTLYMYVQSLSEISNISLEA